MTQPAEEETCPYVAMEEGNIQEQAAAAPNKNDDDPDISIMTPNENSGTQTVGAVLASNDNSSGRKASSGLLPIAVQREDDWGLKAEEPTEIIKSKKAPDASTNPTVAPTVLDVPPRRASSARNHNHLTLACCSSACSAFFTSIGALLGNLLLLYPAIFTIISAIFWYQFAAARGNQGAKCDLDLLGAFFWVSTVLLFLSVVGVMLEPRFRPEYHRYPSPGQPCNLLCECVLTFVELFLGFQAVVWIPEGATCPETAPELFRVANLYLEMQVVWVVASTVLRWFILCWFRRMQ
jgi:hypothetical protein